MGELGLVPCRLVKGEVTQLFRRVRVLVCAGRGRGVAVAGVVLVRGVVMEWSYPECTQNYGG